MNDSNALSTMTANLPGWPESDLRMLPARLSRRLWGEPEEFLRTTNASQIAEWAISVSRFFYLGAAGVTQTWSNA